MYKKICLVGILLLLISCGGGGGGENNGNSNISISRFFSVYSLEETSGVAAFNGMFDEAHGQIVGATRTAGKIGSALDFSRVPRAMVQFDVRPSDTHSIEFSFSDGHLAVGGWFWASTLQADQSFQIFGGSGSGMQSFALKVDQGVPRLVVYQNGQPGAPVVVASSSTPLPAEQWLHVAATYDGNVGKMYIDGTLVSTTSISMSVPNVVNDLFLTFPGKVDEFFFAGRPLNGSDIQAIFLNTQPILPASVPPPQPSGTLLTIQGSDSFGPTAHFGFDELTGTVVANSHFPELAGVLSAGSRTPGVIGNAIDFSLFSQANVHFDICCKGDLSGVGSYRLVFPRDHLTIATWIHPENLVAGATYHLFGDTYTGVQSTKLILQDGFIHVLVNAADTNYLMIKSNTRMANGQWSHIAVTYDTNRAILYLNGVQDAINEITIPIPDMINDFYIGGLPLVSGSAFPGVMDEFYLSSDAFTPQQVMSLTLP